MQGTVLCQSRAGFRFTSTSVFGERLWKENRSLCHPRQVADLAEGDNAAAQPALCVAVLLSRGQGPDCSKDSELPVLTSVEGS